jgi:hypothetical protein
MTGEYGSLIKIYIAAFVVALLLSFVAISTTNYYSSNYSYTPSSALPRNFTTAFTNIFNGYSEGLDNWNFTNVTSAVQNLPQFQFVGMQNYELMSGLLFLAVLSLAMFDFFDKEYGNRKFNPTGAIALFSSFFISLILSQYVVSCYYFCNGGSLSGLSIFQIDSSATTVIFASLTIAAAISGLLAKKMKILDAIGVLIICGAIYAIPLRILVYGLGLGSYANLPLSSYGVHEFGIVAFYAFFIITYVIFSFYADRDYERSE